MRVYKSDEMTVYLLKDKVVIEFSDTLSREPLLPCYYLYIVEFNEIADVYLRKEDVIMKLHDERELKLKVDNPIELIKDIISLTKSKMRVCKNS